MLAIIPAGATHVDPVFLAGNPTCTGQGYAFGFKPKPEPPPSGTYTFPGTSHTVTSTSNGTTFDWTSTLGIDAVIVKGGPNANVYVYDPPTESFGDTGLHSPINPNNNQPYAISHIEFCYDFEVAVSKTAETSFTRTFNWTIDKSVSPDSWDLFTGDTGTSEYSVTVTKTGFTDSDWAVSATITNENNTPFDATIESVSDSISDFGAVAVDCGVTFPHVLASGATLVCSYSTSLPDDDYRLNTATVTTSGAVGGGADSAGVNFGGPTRTVNGTVNVSDTHAGSLGSFSTSGSTSYDRSFTCDDDEGNHDNTATIVETGQADDASVTVNCHALTVTKNASTSFDRTWEWTIDKSADQTDLLLSDGQLFQVNYEVTVDASPVDSGFAVMGDIWVANPAPMIADLTAVSDLVSPNIAAIVDCPALSVPAGGSLHCTYSADLPDGTNRINTATATLQNYDYDSDGAGTSSGTTDFSGSADVAFSDPPDSEQDDCIDVSDTDVGTLGKVCADQAPQTFNYSLWFGAHPDADVLVECGDNSHRNIASFITNDTGSTDDDDWTVNASVACGQGGNGCTLTPGYWKTHSEFGPAPYDDTGGQLANGASTVFFLSGQSYYEVLWTAPKGNAYYILAHAYIAAELNQLNGASIPAEVLEAFNDATSLFNTYSPDGIGDLRGNRSPRPEFIELAGILDEYNNGITAPGHCSE